MHGFYNMALRVNVTQQSFDIKIIPDHVTRKFLGGKGLAIHLLRQHNPAGVDPLSGGNHLLFAIGPATGTGIWGSCRHGVFTKSPYTGCYAESYAGGDVATYIVAAGIDALMIDGASEAPVWLEVSENGVTFHPAEDLWGLETAKTADRIKAWIKEKRPGRPESGVVSIGPGGENLGSFRLIENDSWRNGGRTGVGAVMRAKQIKAVAFWGQRRKELAHPDLIRQFNQEIAQRCQDDAGMGPACGASGRGACHLRATFYKPGRTEVMAPEQLEGQAAGFAAWEERLTVFDALILCRFYRDIYRWEDLATILKGVTGAELEVAGLRKIAAAIAEETRHFNLAEGMTSEAEAVAPTGLPLS